MNFEYVIIEFMDGKVDTISPDNPQARLALEVGKRPGASRVDAINKMAETGYRLLEGTVIP